MLKIFLLIIFFNFHINVFAQESDYFLKEPHLTVRVCISGVVLIFRRTYFGKLTTNCPGTIINFEKFPMPKVFIL